MMLNKRHRREVDAQLRFASASALVVLFAIFVLVLGQRWYASVDEEANEVAELARVIGTNATAALMFNDVLAGHEMLQALRNSSYVVGAALYRPDGSLLADYRSKGWMQLPMSIDAGPSKEIRVQDLREIRVTEPIRYEGHDAGYMVVHASTQRIYAQLKAFVAFFLAIIALAAMMAYLGSYRLRQRIAESRDELLESQHLIRQLTIHREQVVELEHKRIAMEIHDDLGQSLTTAIMGLMRLQRDWTDKESDAAVQVGEVKALVEDAFRSMKNIALDLRPAALNFGLEAALEWLAQRTLGAAGITIHLTVSEPAPRVSEACSITLFRIAQESFSNIVRHAQARTVWITLKQDEEQLSLMIEDDGVGFANVSAQRESGLGLVSIRERARSMQGMADILSRPGKGVCIVVTVPIPSALG